MVDVFLHRDVATQTEESSTPTGTVSRATQTTETDALIVSLVVSTEKWCFNSYFQPGCHWLVALWFYILFQMDRGSHKILACRMMR